MSRKDLYNKDYALTESPYKEEGYQGVLEVSVGYSLGGANYFQGTQEKRGYWLHVMPIGVKDEGTYKSRSFTVGSGPRGFKVFLLEVKRRTPKSDADALRLGALNERRAIERVLAQGLTLAQGVELPPAPAEVPALPSGKVEGQKAPAPISAGQCWLTAEEKARLPALGTTENDENPLAQIKYFDPSGSWTWYGIEYDAAEERFFGYVVGIEPELGYFTLAELREIRGAMGLGVERDRHFRPTPLSELRARAEGAANAR